MRTLSLIFLLTLPAPLSAQEPQETEAPFVREAEPFRLGGEIKAGYRWSEHQESAILSPAFRVLGQMRTPDSGSSFEIQHLGLSGQGEVTSGVFAKFEVRLFDLYNRNPTSTDDTVFVRQAYVRFGLKPEVLSDEPGSRFYALFGQAPRFSKQVVRGLEAYGLWGTAVGRFEQPQLELGAAFGPHLYARAMVGSGNPLFLRDTNVLAGDNLSEAPSSPNATYELGFPIFYDAKVSEVNVGASPETGFGLGGRWGQGEGAAVDVLGWYFSRRLAETARLRGTEWAGELALLRDPAYPIPGSGNRRHEWGVNVQARAKNLRFFGQWLDQDLAGAGRYGLETEVSWNIPLNGLFLVGESVFGNWIQPTFRYSWMENRFEVPINYPRLSVQWPWKKYDFGLRFGLVRDVDLTAEYTIHQVFRTVGLPNLPMQEFVVTLRTGF